MINNVTKSIGKLMLAGSLGLTGAAVSFSVLEQHVSAETAEVINYTQKAKEFVAVAEAEKWEDAYKLLSKNLQSSLTSKLLPQFYSGLTAPYGKVSETKFKELKNDGVHTMASFSVTAEKGSLELVVRLTRDGKVDDFFYDLPTNPASFLNPKYNHPENYSEKQVVIGEGTFSLPGTLTVPKGEGPFPVVVLVHGSGAHDRDETAYVNKPFRDIAVGLANDGIAVLRYDKRTKVHPIKSSLAHNFSIQEETVMDANLAMEKLKSLPEVDSRNIFVLGHSQGAFALPLIIENDKQKVIKGAIGVAGPPGKFQNLLLWQMEQQVKRAKQMNLPQEQIQAAKENLAFFQEQIGLINDPQYSTDKFPANFKLQNPYWWYDIRDYVPAELAKKQNVPMLLLQGGKDMQVEPSQLDVWKKELANRSDVDYKQYPDMFHMLINYPGAVNGMTEYMTPGNVPEVFMSDIAKWVKTGTVGNGKSDLSVYTDYNPNMYWSDAFAWAIDKKIIFGYSGEKKLKPSKALTESEYLRIYLRYYLGSEWKDESLKSVYTQAKMLGLPVKQKQNAILSRGEAAVLLAKGFTNKNMTEKQAVQWLYDHNIASGHKDKDGNVLRTYESFKPNDLIIRAQLVVMLNKIDLMQK
ncbi:hypothetical protein CVD28_08970 [Bacillus sp. M6-12]|uniref:serine aminopeptidase domain-containing protein n=1 Tax=Bacillus sp. M6-12 TaxID=2054166 RepID=UPI000C75E47B|nr:alpha/beta hydrolase [Bacillus sp. M6-12]PLS17821.1 hypothetical protein CVD28_08970 [Bacillus sp. M6-12]